MPVFTQENLDFVIAQLVQVGDARWGNGNGGNNVGITIEPGERDEIITSTENGIKRSGKKIHEILNPFTEEEVADLYNSVFEPTSNPASNAPEGYSIGPGGGGAIMHPAINPHDPNNIFLACDMGSSFISHDKGQSWKSHNFGCQGANDIARAFFSPHDPNIMYVGGGALSASSGVYYADGVLFVSHDKGKTFVPLYPSPDRFVDIFNTTPYYQYTSGYGPGGYIYNVTVHPTDPNTIFILTSRGYIRKSTDAGATWSVFGTLPGGGGSTVLFSGRHVANMTVFGNELRIAVDIGFFSFDLTTGERTDIPDSASKGQCMIVKDGQMTVCVLRDITGDSNFTNQIFKTTNFGQTWVNISSNFKSVLTPPPGRTLREFDPNAKITFGTATSHGYRPITMYDQNTLYIAFTAATSPVTYQIVGGVAKTTDGGNTWKLMFDSWNVNDGGFTSLDPVSTTPAYGNSATVASYTGPNRGLLVSSVDPDHVIACTNIGAYQSLNGGLTWDDVASKRTDNNPLLTPYNVNGTLKSGSVPTWTTRGIEPAGQHYLAVNPHNKNDWITGWTDIGTWRSLDSGKSWSCLRPGKNEMETCSHAAAFDPHNPGHILWSSSARQSINTFAAAYGTSAILYRSTDNGQTWVALPTSTWYSEADDGFHVSAIIYDPHNANVVYASAVGEGTKGGVWKSVDAGATWTRIVSGMTPHCNSSGVPSVGFVPRLSLSNDGKTLLCRMVQQYTSLSSDTNAQPGNRLLWKDAPAYRLDIFNGSTAWVEIPRPNDNAVGLRSLAMDSAGVLYATTNTQQNSWALLNINDARPFPYEFGGAYVSEDNGVTWRQMFRENGSTYAIHVSKQDVNRLILSTHMGAVYTSHKGADTTLSDWELLSGSTVFCKWQHIYEDPNDTNRIIVTTGCGGTWSLPVGSSVQTFSAENMGQLCGLLKQYLDTGFERLETRITDSLHRIATSGDYDDLKNTPGEHFKLTIDTRQTTTGFENDDTAFAIPITGAFAYDWWINWGDGTPLEHTGGTDMSIPHTYPSAGRYHITIRPAGEVTAWFRAFRCTPTHADCIKIISPDSLLTVAMVAAPGATTVPSDSFGHFLRNCTGIDFTMGDHFGFAQEWEKVTSVGSRFFSYAFAYCNGNNFTMGRRFNFPQHITNVNDEFGVYAFTTCNGSAFTMNDICNLPQALLVGGYRFCRAMFAYCSGSAFTMNDVWNTPPLWVPQNLSAGTGVYQEMFSGCNAASFQVNDIFRFPLLTQDQVNASGTFTDTFRSINTHTQTRTPLSIINGNPDPASAKGTFGLAFPERNMVHANWRQ